MSLMKKMAKLIQEDIKRMANEKDVENTELPFQRGNKYFMKYEEKLIGAYNPNTGIGLITSYRDENYGDVMVVISYFEDFIEITPVKFIEILGLNKAREVEEEITVYGL